MVVWVPAHFRLAFAERDRKRGGDDARERGETFDLKREDFGSRQPQRLA
jgi:hypothetical protein